MKAPSRAFSGHCKTSRRFVDSSTYLAAVFLTTSGTSVRNFLTLPMGCMPRASRQSSQFHTWAQHSYHHSGTGGFMSTSHFFWQFSSTNSTPRWASMQLCHQYLWMTPNLVTCPNFLIHNLVLNIDINVKVTIKISILSCLLFKHVCMSPTMMMFYVITLEVHIFCHKLLVAM